MNNTNINTGSSKKAKIGSYSVAVIAIVLAVLVLINLAVENLPTRLTKYSVSNLGLYDIEETTEKLVKGIDEKVNIYVVAAKDYLDEVIYTYTEKVSELNSNITVEKIDPNLKPAFISQYTDEELSSSETNIIVSNPKNNRVKIIYNSDIYTQEYSDYEIQMYYYYYGYAPENPTYFNLESLLDTALDYTTSDKLPIMLYTSGHGETEFDSTFTTTIESENMELASVDLKSEEISDCDALIINMPTLDFTEDEISVVKSYLDNGGNVILTTGVSSNLDFYELTNLYALANEYGLIYSGHLVCDQNSYYQVTPYILAQVVSNDYSANVQSNTNVILPTAHEIIVADELPDGVEVNELFTTSVGGYVKETIDLSASMPFAKEDADRSGKIVIGAEAVKDNSKIIWISSPYLLDGSTVGYYSNMTYAMTMLSVICDKGESITAASKTLSVEALQVDESTAQTWGIVITAVIPIIILVIGFIIWRRRLTR